MASVTITGLTELKTKLNRAKNLKTLVHAVNMASAVLEQKTKPKIPTNRYGGGGKLKGALTIIPAEIKGSEIVGGIVNPTEYAIYVEYGVGREAVGTHPKAEGFTYRMTPWVYPKETKDGLRFIKTNGYKAKAPMYRGLKEAKLNIKQIISQAVSESIRG